MLTVADVMTRDVWTIRSSAKLAQAIAFMQAKQVRSLIVERVVEGGAYGILTVKDIVYRVTAKSIDPTKVMVCEVMKHPCLTVSSMLSLPALANCFLQANERRAVVIEQEQLLGIVSVADIVMKSNIETVELPTDLFEQIETALRHNQLSWTESEQVKGESEAAIEILKKLR
ncbi:CBS domain-containing protein [cf. Phormidesmis sp. LEGE 11477]|uniref:CBS domain-containing protein n=1 Tax=cf. Phormidesmis sp. LEGE 11477 TaxID=1828680 RepID=UPI001882E76F|nr:CBS domain-containing protein [cf. Phormidesmis sp. LEGE 11477]MBE9063078.1 CBS domain-containing protein [cf. Phormidesmis sp. LEGE 11477]